MKNNITQTFVFIIYIIHANYNNITCNLTL